MKLKPFALVAATFGGVLGAPAIIASPLPSMLTPVQSAASSAGTFAKMPIPSIQPVTLDTPSAKNLIELARSEAEQLERTQSSKIAADIGVSGIKVASLDGVDSTGSVNGTPRTDATTTTINTPPPSPEGQCLKMGGTWSGNKCNMPSSGGASRWIPNAKSEISKFIISINETGTALNIRDINYFDSLKIVEYNEEKFYFREGDFSIDLTGKLYLNIYSTDENGGIYLTLTPFFISYYYKTYSDIEVASDHGIIPWK
jgi:hypothetical protein